MSKLIFAMTQSLDGYVSADDKPGLAPDLVLFRHFIDFERGLAGALYGRRIYEIMRYWDEDQPGWEAHEHDFSAVWRAHPKWVVSRTLQSVGPNAVLVHDDVETFARDLKAQNQKDIAVAGPELAWSLGKAGLVDEYHLYFRPFVLGGGKPFFAGALPKLHLLDSERVGDDAIRVRYRSGT